MTAPYEVRIERLGLRVSGMPSLDPRSLARAVAEGLAPTLAVAPGETSIDRLAITVQAAPDEASEELAARAVARLAPLINRVGPAEAGQ